MNSEIKRIAEMYQQETGEGLPFGGSDVDLAYLTDSFRKNEKRLRELKLQDDKLRRFFLGITPKRTPNVT